MVETGRSALFNVFGHLDSISNLHDSYLPEILFMTLGNRTERCPDGSSDDSSSQHHGQYPMPRGFKLLVSASKDAK